MNEFDLYDVLADIAFGVAPLTRVARAYSFGYKQRAWLDVLPNETKSVILVIVAQFGREGIEAFESPQLFNVQAVSAAGGISALKKGGNPAELIREAKARLLAA
jgi:hypothetical protein